MKIIYITTSTTNSEIELAIQNDTVKYNPSNQNFHHSLIRAFACNFNVEVLSSYKCFNKNKVHEFEDYINYNFLNASNNKLFKIISLRKSLENYIKHSLSIDNNLILVVDAMNFSLGYCATKIAKKYHLPIIGIISDHPKMLKNASKSYTKNVINSFKKYDAYIFLTEALEKAFNKNKKPSLIINGIYMRTASKIHKEKVPYFFFSGALYEKYGVKTLIDAFLQTGNDYNLIIAGNGEMKNYIVKKSIRTKRIKYVGVLSQETLQAYQNNAIANINPRPYTKEMDAYCIPSKMFEYIASNALVISTHHSLLYKDFKSSVVWCKDNEKDLVDTIESVVQMKNEERNKRIKYGHNVINKKYSLNFVAKMLDSFIKSII